MEQKTRSYSRGLDNPKKGLYALVSSKAKALRDIEAM